MCHAWANNVCAAQLHCCRMLHCHHIYSQLQLWHRAACVCCMTSMGLDLGLVKSCRATNVQLLSGSGPAPHPISLQLQRLFQGRFLRRGPRHPQGKSGECEAGGGAGGGEAPGEAVWREGERWRQEGGVADGPEGACC